MADPIYSYNRAGKGNYSLSGDFDPNQVKSLTYAGGGNWQTDNGKYYVPNEFLFGGPQTPNWGGTFYNGFSDPWGLKRTLEGSQGTDDWGNEVNTRGAFQLNPQLAGQVSNPWVDWKTVDPERGASEDLSKGWYFDQPFMFNGATTLDKPVHDSGNGFSSMARDIVQGTHEAAVGAPSFTKDALQSPVGPAIVAILTAGIGAAAGAGAGATAGAEGVDASTGLYAGESANAGAYGAGAEATGTAAGAGTVASEWESAIGTTPQVVGSGGSDILSSADTGAFDSGQFTASDVGLDSASGVSPMAAGPSAESSLVDPQKFAGVPTTPAEYVNGPAAAPDNTLFPGESANAGSATYGTTGGGPTGMPTQPGIIDGAMDWAKKNPVLALGGTSLAMGAVKGVADRQAANTIMDKKIAADRALQQQRLDQQMALEEWKRRFTQGGSYYDANVPFRPAQNTTLRRPDGAAVYGPNGIINSAMR